MVFRLHIVVHQKNTHTHKRPQLYAHRWWNGLLPSVIVETLYYGLPRHYYAWNSYRWMIHYIAPTDNNLRAKMPFIRQTIPFDPAILPLFFYFSLAEEKKHIHRSTHACHSSLVRFTLCSWNAKKIRTNITIAIFSSQYLYLQELSQLIQYLFICLAVYDIHNKALSKQTNRIVCLLFLCECVCTVYIITSTR